MDFVNRLKPEHLQSFWYFASKVNFALIGTFGSLLWATSPNMQEAEFYKARLSEYRWTLRVSSRGAEFMEYAVGVLDASAGYLQQEQFRKKGLANAMPGYPSTVGAGENFGLGMGVGTSASTAGHPPPPPPPPPSSSHYNHISSHTQHWATSQNEQDHEHPASPITYDSSSDHEHDHEAEMTDGSSTSPRPLLPHLHSNSQSPSMKGFHGFPFDTPEGFETQDHIGSNASTPTSTSSGFDFFMIPNTIPSRPVTNGTEQSVVTRGEFEFLATAGWRGREE
jgi:hypothetical protein